MVSESAQENAMGKSFGIHKALDMAGSAIGILLSYLLLEKFRKRGRELSDGVCHFHRSEFVGIGAVRLCKGEERATPGQTSGNDSGAIFLLWIAV